MLARLTDILDKEILEDIDVAYIVGTTEEKVKEFRLVKNQNEGTATSVTKFTGKYGFLSNFYSVNLELVDKDGIKYHSVENYFQAQKVMPGANGINLKRSFSCCEPGQAKYRGRRLPYIRKDWETVKESVMLEALRKKFAPGSELAKKLLETGTMELIEGNNHGDTEWGVVDGKGENKLGKLLMQVREELAVAAK